MVDHTTDEVQKKGATSREAMHNLGAQLKEMYNKLAEFQTMKGRCLFPRRYGAFEGRSSNVVSLAGSVYKPEASLSKILHSSRSEKAAGQVYIKNTLTKSAETFAVQIGYRAHSGSVPIREGP